MSTQSFSRLETACLEGRAQSTRFRQRQFHSLHTALRAGEKTIKDAIVSDTGHSDTETILEYTLALSELHTHYSSLDLEEDLKSQRALEDLKATTNVGIVYVIPASQNLYYSVISVLTAAIAAGNCIILELPTTLTHVSRVLRELLPAALDADTFSISSSRPSSEFLSKCHLVRQEGDTQLQATNTASGLLQSSQAAKTVAIVDRTADIAAAALAIVPARVTFNGRSAYRPDIVLVNEFVVDDFLYHSIQAISSPLPHRRLLEEEPQAPGGPKALREAQLRTMKEIESNESLEVIVSGSNGGVVEIKDRRTAPPFGRRIEGRVMLVCRVTSLDDAIDLCHRYVLTNFETPLEASYVFAATPEANYLSRFISARVSCINHIPTELLVGPFAPKHQQIAPSPSPRYTPSYFQTPRPRIAHVSPVSKVGQDAARSRSTDQIESWSRSVLDAPLPEVKQGSGRAVGFFDQALILVGISVLSVILGSGLVLFRMQRRSA